MLRSLSPRRAALLLALIVGVPAAAAAPVQAHKAHCIEPSPLDATGPRIGLTPVATVDRPVHVAGAPGDPSRLYVVERTGRIRVIKDGVLLEEPFLDLRPSVEASVDDANNERGMQSLAFAPDYARSGRFYVFFSDLGGDTHVRAFRRSANPDVAVPKGRDVLRVEHSASDVHYGGGMAFGPDGALYVALGEAERFGWAQSMRKPFYGKVVRSTLKRGSRWRIVAVGLRNPYRIGFRPTSGDLYIGDVGEDTYEEINLVPRTRRRTIPNFGWPHFEGRRRRSPGPPARPTPPALQLPHPGAHAIVAGPIVTTEILGSALRGRLLLGDFCAGTVSSVVLRRRGMRAPRAEEITVPYVSSIATGSDGAVYASSLLGEIYRLTPAG